MDPSVQTTLNRDLEFVLFNPSENNTNGTFPVIGVHKVSRCYEVRSEDKRLWIACSNAIVNMEFQRNVYNKSQNAGHVACELTMKNDIDAIVNVDQQVQQIIFSQPQFAVINNMRMTDRTWKRMFRPSLQDLSTSTIRMSVTKNLVAFFDKDKNLMPNDVGWHNFQLERRVNFVIEPCYLWFMEDRGGLSWTLRQVRFLDDNVVDKVPEETLLDIILDDDY